MNSEKRRSTVKRVAGLNKQYDQVLIKFFFYVFKENSFVDFGYFHQQPQSKHYKCCLADWAIFTWIAFSWRLRYLVFSDILSGTWSKLFLVQMTLLAWLEQEQRVGHGGAAPVSWGPWLGNHNRSWTNQRRGEGVKGLVTMTRRMATESWPTPIAKMLISHLQKREI